MEERADGLEYNITKSVRSMDLEVKDGNLNSDKFMQLCLTSRSNVF